MQPIVTFRSDGQIKVEFTDVVSTYVRSGKFYAQTDTPVRECVEDYASYFWDHRKYKQYFTHQEWIRVEALSAGVSVSEAKRRGDGLIKFSKLYELFMTEEYCIDRGGLLSILGPIQPEMHIQAIFMTTREAAKTLGCSIYVSDKLSNKTRKKIS